MSSTTKFRLSLQEISLATNNFDEENIIGRGGYGLVYRGQSEQHGVLAIKRLNRVYGQGDHEYGMEVQLLSRYKHENLVSLIGFCGEDGEKIVVYKYEANQSLDKHLNRKDLSWTCRLNICLGAARGLRYLHNETGSEHGIIHRDIKSSNILLDENRKAKISDFGLSKIALTSSADSILFTAACGTLGYLDPEYINYGTLTQKSDVYSFGVVLFEVLFGKLVTIVGHGDDGRRFTVVMARRHYEEDTLDVMIDPDLRNEMNLASLRVFSSIAYHCIKNKREDRPTMNSVVEVLEKVFSYQRARTYKILESSSSKFLDDDSDGDDDGSGNYDNPMCQVDDCKKELWGAKDYHRNHKVCEVHCKSVEALVGKQMQRFCQRCGKFHLLFEFEEGKRSCWPRLAGHNKPRSEGVMGNSFLLNANSNENMDVVNLINVLGFRVTTSQEAKA